MDFFLEKVLPPTHFFQNQPYYLVFFDTKILPKARLKILFLLGFFEITTL